MNKILLKLKQNNIDYKIISIAKTGSIYLEFKYKEIGKLRIGDHNERERYGYKWQIRTDQKEDFIIDKSKGHNQYFYSINNIDQFIEDIKKKISIQDQIENFIIFLNKDNERNI